MISCKVLLSFFLQEMENYITNRYKKRSDAIGYRCDLIEVEGTLQTYLPHFTQIMRRRSVNLIFIHCSTIDDLLHECTVTFIMIYYKHLSNTCIHRLFKMFVKSQWLNNNDEHSPNARSVWGTFPQNIYENICYRTNGPLSRYKNFVEQSTRKTRKPGPSSAQHAT